MTHALYTNMATPALLNADITAAATSIVVQSGQGALFPAVTGGNYFYATLFHKYESHSGANEIVKCTARSGDTLTVTRAQGGTTAGVYYYGDKIEIRLTAEGLEEFSVASEIATDLATTTHAATSKETPVDADEFSLYDSVAAALKKLTYANLLATLKAAGGTWVHTLTGNVTGNLTGNVTGNLTGNVTGNVTGNLTGTASQATTATTATQIDPSPYLASTIGIVIANNAYANILEVTEACRYEIAVRLQPSVADAQCMSFATVIALGPSTIRLVANNGTSAPLTVNGAYIRVQNLTGGEAQYFTSRIQLG